MCVVPRLSLLLWLSMLTPIVGALPEELEIALTTSVATRHVHRGVERTRGAGQVELEAAWQGWRGRLWSNRAFASDEPGEVQSSLAHGWMLGQGIEAELRGTQFWHSRDPRPGAAVRSFETAASLSRTWRGGWRSKFGCSYDFKLRARVVEATFGCEFPLKNLGAFLEGWLHGGHVAGGRILPEWTGSRARDDYGFFGAGLRLPYRVGAHTTIVAEAQLVGTANQARSWSPSGSGTGGRASVKIGASFDF